MRINETVDKQYRFYEQRGQMKWYLESNCKTYTPHRDQAGTFTERDWQLWGKRDFGREEIGQDKAPELPGLVLSNDEGIEAV